METKEAGEFIDSAQIMSRQVSGSADEGDYKVTVSPSMVTWNDGALDFMFRDDFILMHVEWACGVITACERYLDNPLGIYVCNPIINLCDLDAFLESRCFPDSRDNGSTLLADLGFRNATLYDSMEICRRTHGLQWDDFFWVRFSGDTLRYAEIKLRE